MSTKSTDDDTTDAARDLVETVKSETKSRASEDGLTRSEREIEQKKMEERRRKAQELKKQLRMRDLGMVRYRWSAALLVIVGALSMLTEFLIVMIRPPDIGFDTFLDGFFKTGNGFFLFPLIAGVLLIVCGVFAYWHPKATFLSVIPAGMMAMAGGMIYFLVTFAVTADPSVEVYSTVVPGNMILLGIIALISILLRERI